MKTAKTTLAILLALCVLLSLTSAAFADDPQTTLYDTVTVNGDTVTVGGTPVTFTDGSAENVPITNDGNEVTVGANINTVTSYGGNGGNGVVADGANVTVTGSVSGQETGVVATDATVEVGGSVSGSNGNGVEATNGAKVNVGGDVNGYDTGVKASGAASVVDVTGSVNGKLTGVEASGGATVEVGGSVSGSNVSGVVASGGATVTVTGNVSGYENSVVASGGATVTVDGDVTARNNGISAGSYSTVETEKSTILVQGTVSAGEGGYGVMLAVPPNCSVDDVKDVLPDIIVQSLATDADHLVTVSGYNSSDLAGIKQAVIDSIMYIVETVTEHENSADTSVTASLGGGYTSTTVGGKDLNVATTGSQLTLAVDGAKGDIVGVKVGNEKSEANPDGNSITRAEDGSWVITVGIGGGLKIIATIITPEPEPEPEPEPKKETKAQPQPERRAATKLNAGAGASAPAGKALVTVDYKNRTLIIDMTTTNTETLLTDTLRRFQKTNGIDTVKILVPNGSYTIAMADLLEMLGMQPSLTLVSADSTLEMRAGGVTVATLVMSTAA